jgi:hypothetical protein
VTDFPIHAPGERVTQELAVARADLHVASRTADFHQGGVGKSLQFFDQGAHRRHPGLDFFPGMAQVLLWNEMQGHGKGSRRDPEVHVRAVGVEFIHINPNHTLAKRVSAGQDKGSADSQSRFS